MRFCTDATTGKGRHLVRGTERSASIDAAVSPAVNPFGCYAWKGILLSGEGNRAGPAQTQIWICHAWLSDLFLSCVLHHSIFFSDQEVQNIFYKRRDRRLWYCSIQPCHTLIPGLAAARTDILKYSDHEDGLWCTPQTKTGYPFYVFKTI